MRTLLLLATAATVAWMAQDAQAQTRTERRVIVVQPQHGAPADGEVYRNGDDRMLNERDYRGRWVEGEWTPDRRRFEGVYEVDERGGARQGDMRGHGAGHGERHGAGYDGPPPGYDGPPPGYRAVPDGRDGGGWDDEEMMRRCNGRSGNGIAGAAAGGLAGGLIGNRVAGRGDRRIGTAIGAVAGAAAGAAIQRSANNRGCDDWYRDYQGRSSRGSYESYGEGGGYTGGGDYGYGYGGMQTIVIPGQPVIIEETETTYETVVIEQARPRIRHRAAPRRVVHRPRPRPRCTCR